jgi:hypothetical protein
LVSGGYKVAQLFFNLNFQTMRPLLLAGLLFTMLAACQRTAQETSSNSLNVAVYLTDDQALIFDKVFIDLRKLEIKIEDDGVDSLGGWFTLDIRPGVYNILKFRNGVDTLFATGNIPVNRKLQKLRLTVGTNNSVEKDGRTFPLLLHKNRSEVIAKLDDANVEFIQPNQLRFWLDFDAGRSIREKNGNYELESQIRIFSKKTAGRLEGKVLPGEARAIVLAINGSDTATARPEDNGEFRFVGLVPGTYKVFIDATANSYSDTLLNNIRIVGGEDTKLGTIRLRN